MRKIVKRGLALGLSLILGMGGNTGGLAYALHSRIVAKAMAASGSEKLTESGIDILDYENNTSATEFVVNDIAGMEKLAALVNGGNKFTNKTIMLKADLKYDKTVRNNHKVIGDVKDKYIFNGTFDGGFHTISGINLYSDSVENVGLFGMAGNDAMISKIILEDSSIVAQRPGLGSTTATELLGIGGIVGYSKNSTISECISGKDVEVIVRGAAFVGGIIGCSISPNVTKCINYATISASNGTNAVGGIVGDICNVGSSEKCHVKRCINYGTINASEYCFDVGGISGNNQDSKEWEGIVECCNMGKLISEDHLSNAWCGMGGISNACLKVMNCYNAGYIVADTGIYVGGIVGYPVRQLEPISSIQNSYSVGQIQNSLSGAVTSSVHALIWKLSNCYWLTGIADVGICEREHKADSPQQDMSSVFEYSKSQMQSQAYVDELNENSKNMGYGEVWAADTKNINNGYPILKNVPYTVEDLINSSVSDKDKPNIPDEDEPDDTTPALHFYEDHKYTAQATNSTISLYANGGVVAVPGTTEKKNYKRCVLYTDITPSYIYTVGKNGAVKPSIGKVAVGITSSDAKPILVKGKIVDKDASKIASASIKNGQITVTAKSQSGKVYLWAIDTGSVGESACIPVTVKAAPTATNIYAVPDTDSSFIYGKTKQFKSDKISVGESTKVYLYPTYKENGAVQKAKKVSYIASVAAKSADYFSVKQSDSNPLCFEISAKGLKDGKSVTGAITFICSLNGKKVAFKATAINQVTGISTTNASGMTRESDSSFKIKASDSEKTTGTFEMQTVCSSNTDASTDILKIYAMGSADGYDTAQFEAGKVKITKKRSGVQSKISMKPAKDKKTVIVTAAKGTKPVTAYFLAVYNNVNSGLKKGYMVISVTAE